MVKKAILIFLIWSNFCLAKQNQQPLFLNDAPLEIIINLNVNELIDDRIERLEHEAQLFYAGNTDNKLDIKLSVRGNTRAKPELCDFPPLTLNLKKKQVKGTPFEGQNKLKLVTHCRARDINEQYVLREYYVYKLYQLITPYALKVRLCKISYQDSEGKFDPEPLIGFLIEDIDELAKRNNMQEYDGKIINQEACYRAFLDKLTIFEYMIGNLDWSIPLRHNFKLVYGDDYPIPVAVPYDFDFSGIVNTNYSQPPDDIDISSVRIRVFRGLCRTAGTYEEVIEYYKEIKPQVYQLYNSSPYLDEKSIDSTIKYLDLFYKVIENPKQVDSKINRACRAAHDHLYN